MTKTVEENNDGEVGAAGQGKFNHGRRNFLAHSGMFGAGLMGSALLGACSDSDVLAQMDNCEDFLDDNVSDAAVLQFALNLEYLEAEFYLRATTGMGLPDDLITAKGITSGPGSTPGNVIVPQMNKGPVAFNSMQAQHYANEIAADERNHVRFLRTALEGAGVPVPSRPKLDLSKAFQTAATVAGVSNPQGFNPFASELFFLLGAYIFEDVGVTAYKGGAPFLKNETYLSAAAGILAAEAYHAGLVRTVLYSKGQNVRGITDGISDARDSLDGKSDLDQGTSNQQVTLRGQTYTASNIVPLDKNGVAFSRTPGQIHNIAYLTPTAATSGGFFPDGTTIPANPALQKSADNS